MDVCIILGSKSDLPVANKCVSVLDEFSISHEVRVASAHRAPKFLESVIESSIESGCRVFIGMAGMAAALPGVIASMTTLPVIGVPVGGKVPLDSLLSIVQMPAGIPVGTLAIGKAGATNAGLMAAAILALSDPDLAERLKTWRQNITDNVAEAPKD